MERQDIDALLIGALYGELTPAEEARLTAHLESHPTDRGALDDLKVTRQAVLESRIFSVQVEPPQAISALLLQEAHHRAPKRAAVAADEPRESWFFRFTRVFLAHPAMAAAAMLVLVLGGAALMHNNKKDAVATKEVAAPAGSTVATDMPAAAPETATATAPAAAGSGSAAWGSAYGADLYEGGEADGTAAATQGAENGAMALDKGSERRRDVAAQEQQAQSDDRKRKSATHSMAVTTAKGAPKALSKADEEDDDFGLFDGDAAKPSGPGGGGGAGAAAPVGGSIGRGGGKGGYAQPPPTATNKPASSAAPAPAVTGSLAAPTSPPMPEPKPAPDAKAPAKVASTTTKTATKAEKPAETIKQEAKPADSSLIAWAKSEHARAVSLAQRGECTSAAKVALAVNSRASDYYAQYMATDRALKQCAQYINAEREKDAEKSAKARAQKRTNADEPANISK